MAPCCAASGPARARSRRRAGRPAAAKATLYGLAGTFAFLAGIVITASTRGGDPTGATSMTLLSVAAVILGGAAFSGGVVAPIGALFGTLTLVMVGTLLSLFEVSAVYLPMVQGLMLLGAIGIRTLLTWQDGDMTAPAGLRRQPWFWPAAASVILIVMIVALSPEFRYSIVTANLTAASFLALVGIGQMFPVASGEGGIDLSIPFVMNFCAFLAVQLSPSTPCRSRSCCCSASAFGIAVGLVNGLVVVAGAGPADHRHAGGRLHRPHPGAADLRERRHDLCRPHADRPHALAAARPTDTFLRRCSRSRRWP